MLFSVLVLVLPEYFVAADRLSELRLEWKRLEAEQQFLRAKKASLERSLGREAVRKSFYDAVAQGFEAVGAKSMAEGFPQAPQAMSLDEKVVGDLEEMMEQVRWDHESARAMHFSILTSSVFKPCLDPLVRLNAFEPPVHYSPTEYEVGKTYKALKHSIPSRIVFKRELDAWNSHLQQLIARKKQEVERRNRIMQAIEEAESSDVLGSTAAAVLDSAAMALAVKMPCSRWNETLKKARGAILRDEMHGQCLEALRGETRRHGFLQTWFTQTAPLLFQFAGTKEPELLENAAPKTDKMLPEPKTELIAMTREDDRLWTLVSQTRDVLRSTVWMPFCWLHVLEERMADLEWRRGRLAEKEAAWRAAYGAKAAELFAREISRLEVLELSDTLPGEMGYLESLWEAVKCFKDSLPQQVNGYPLDYA